MLACSKPIRVLKRLRYRALQWLRPQPRVAARVCGIRLEFEANCRIGEDVYANAFERRQRRVIHRLVEPGSTVIDVGANIGFYTCLLAKHVGSTGRVIAVEPTPSVYEDLRRNVGRNGFDDRVTLLPAALSDKAGTATLKVFDRGDEVYNSVGAVVSPAGNDHVSAIQVPTQTLNELLSHTRRDRPCFVKVDVEGFQKQVLEGGAEQLTERGNIMLMVELSQDSATQCGGSVNGAVRLLGGFGYQAYLPGERGELQPAPESATLWNHFSGDVFFLKNAALLAA